jgi:hypothetical protein
MRPLDALGFFSEKAETGPFNLSMSDRAAQFDLMFAYANDFPIATMWPPINENLLAYNHRVWPEYDDLVSSHFPLSR